MCTMLVMIMSLLLLPTFTICGEEPELSTVHIADSGYYPPMPDDVALVFYVTVENQGPYPVHNLVLNMDKCCRVLHREDQLDCQSMRLLGDGRQTLHPEHSINMTLVYSTKYPYDLQGECHVYINHDKEVSLHHSILFDTRLTQPQWMPPILQGLVMGIKVCETEDQDRLRGCQPVDCRIKYNGHRNYYNPHTKLCEKLKPCISNPNAYLPTKALNLRENKCKELSVRLTESDAAYFDQELHHGPYEDFSLTHMYHLVCDHGTMLENGTGCECDEGWRTAPLDDPVTYNPTTRMVFMCNIHDLSYLEAIRHHKILVIMITLAVFCSLFLLFLCGLCLQEVCIRHRIHLPCGLHQSSSLDNEAALVRKLSPITASLSSLTAKVTSKRTPGEPRGHIFKYARVQIPNHPVASDELELFVGDIILDLEQTDYPGIWTGTCRGQRGMFPVSCAQFYTDMSQQTE